MSFIQSREKVMMERFIRAEEIRNEKKKIVKQNSEISSIREKLTKASERVKSLENNLKLMSGIREKRRHLREQFENSEKDFFQCVLKEKIKVTTLAQELKLSKHHSFKRKKYFLHEIDTEGTLNNSINIVRLSPINKKVSKTPEIVRQNLRLLSEKTKNQILGQSPKKT